MLFPRLHRSTPQHQGASGKAAEPTGRMMSRDETGSGALLATTFAAILLPRCRSGDATVLRKVLWLFLVAILSGCEGRAVRNSADFATSLNELTKREVLSNLRKVYDEGATFVPSHVIVSQGKSSTSAAVRPSFTIPLGPGFTNTVVPTGNSFQGVTTFLAASVTLAGDATVSQDWTMTPATDADVLMRLRTLYLYVAGEIHSETEFLCNYPVQRYPVTLEDAGTGNNIAYRLDECPGKPTFYADPNFVTFPNCIVCIASAGLAARKDKVKDAAKSAKAEVETLTIKDVKLNDRVRRSIVGGIGRSGEVLGNDPYWKEPQKGDRNLSRDLTAESQEIIPLSQINFPPVTQVYLKAGNDKPFRDFILFTYVAMAQTTPKK